MMIKAIKTREDYDAALLAVEKLMDAEPGSPEENNLEVLGVLIEAYEAEHFPIDSPDPVDAILFRMDQMGLTRKDLIPLIGSQSKVSEVLNRKKSLSLGMIRRLHAELGIPAEVLLGSDVLTIEEQKFRAEDYPFAEMYHSGYFAGFTGTLREAKDASEELLTAFFSKFTLPQTQAVYCRHSGKSVDGHALQAWQTQAAQMAMVVKTHPYQLDLISHEFLRDIIKLSRFEEGPKLVKELLSQKGVVFVCLPHLPRTYLDGACFKDEQGRPVVGLTLRQDRLDNFWFTLAHELAHIKLHLDTDDVAFFDDTESGSDHACDQRETEANNLAADLLIPDKLWVQNQDRLLSAVHEEELQVFADEANVSVSIVAGRIRNETKDFRKFSSMIGQRSVRKLFV